MYLELFIICCLALALYNYFTRHNETDRVPEVPWSVPILGHLPYFGSNPAKTFLKWKKVYGPIFSVKIGSYYTIVLNDEKMIKEAFNLPQFSGRPRLPNMTSIGTRGVLWSDGPRFYDQRNFISKLLNDLGIGRAKLDDMFQEEMSVYFQNLSSKHNTKTGAVVKVDKFFQIPVINTVWRVLIGKRFNDGDNTVADMTELLHRVTKINSTKLIQLSWLFPWLSKLLSFVGKNAAVDGWHDIIEFVSKEIDKARENYTYGNPRHFTDAYFDKVKQTTDPMSSFHESQQEQAPTTADVFAGAIDSVTTTLDWFLLYMAREPEIQRKLQEETDRVVQANEDSCPNCPVTFANRIQMPFTQSVIHELFRISSTAPIALMHRTTENVEFHGYKIPKDAVIIPNLYGIHMDLDVWSDPQEFKPERFLDEEGNLNERWKELLPFSSGKRLCPGSDVARDQIFILVTNFFHRFKISSADKSEALSDQANFALVVSPFTFNVIVQERKPLLIK